MILVGRLDSPVETCVATTMTVHSLSFDHKGRSVFGSANRVQVFKSLMRMPALVSDCGAVLTDILCYLAFWIVW